MFTPGMKYVTQRKPKMSSLFLSSSFVPRSILKRSNGFSKSAVFAVRENPYFPLSLYKLLEDLPRF
jgi:hypothetical protein